MTCRLFLVSIAALPVVLTACSDQESSDIDQDVANKDPVISRALNDPLMIDPDLAWVNEANAAITYVDSHALPAFSANPAAADLARDAARIELREAGSIEELPIAEGLLADESFSGLATLREILDAAGAPEPCGEGASDNLEWAAKMPEVAAIMPHGMVQQAAGSDNSACAVRVVRYLTQVDVKDALQYHFTKGSQAKFEVSYKSRETDLIKAERAGQKMLAEIDEAQNGLRMVTLVHWKN